MKKNFPHNIICNIYLSVIFLQAQYIYFVLLLYGNELPLYRN